MVIRLQWRAGRGPRWSVGVNVSEPVPEGVSPWSPQPHTEHRKELAFCSRHRRAPSWPWGGQGLPGTGGSAGAVVGSRPDGVSRGPLLAASVVAPPRRGRGRCSLTGSLSAGWCNIFTVAPTAQGPRSSEDCPQERERLGKARLQGCGQERPPPGSQRRPGEDGARERRKTAWPWPSGKRSGKRRPWRDSQGSRRAQPPLSGGRGAAAAGSLAAPL